MKDNEGNILIYKEGWCKVCNQQTRFINIGNKKDEFICGICHSKTDFGKKRLITNQFGTYFVENDKNSLELRERIIEKLKTDGYLYSEFRNFLKWKNLDIELIFSEISNPENLINLYKKFKGEIE